MTYFVSFCLSTSKTPKQRKDSVFWAPFVVAKVRKLNLRDTGSLCWWDHPLIQPQLTALWSEPQEGQSPECHTQLWREKENERVRKYHWTNSRDNSYTRRLLQGVPVHQVWETDSSNLSLSLRTCSGNSLFFFLQGALGAMESDLYL